eukprot:GFUD01010299.1.p1 GENE.GFUD01010299.1~~GFUD01010299.1.p1  ORF type:complete len:220 (-),score=41.95 GFUD01010299.1:75-734(-)
MQKQIISLCLFSLVSLVFSDEFCGPQSCGLMCEGGEKCVEDNEVNCCCEPCCARWSCNSIFSPSPKMGCPEERPEFNSPCGNDEDGLHCDFGTIECCGETFPEISMECADGMWIGYYIDTLCILGLAPPCPDDTTTEAAKIEVAKETTTGIVECPAERPDENSTCMDGLYCPYGMEECCGEMIPDMVFECYEGQWGIMIIDSLCDFGIPCPDESTTLEV